MNRTLYMCGYMRRRREGVTPAVNKKTCAVCGGTFTAKQEAKTCSTKCRKRLSRQGVTLVVNTDVTPAVNTLSWERPTWEVWERYLTRGGELVRVGTATINYERTWRWATDKLNTLAVTPPVNNVTPPVNNVTPAVNTLTTAWRYRVANNYAAGMLINRTGSIDRTSVEAVLRERYEIALLELEPCL